MQLTPVYRITVFVPPQHLQALQQGIVEVDSLQAGHYDRSMWLSAPGVEQFRPLPGADPGQGSIGELMRAPTVRLELSIPRDPQRLQRLIEQGIHAHHPWEVPSVFVDEAWFPVP